NVYGGTVGGPIVRNRLFYFCSWGRYHDRRCYLHTFGVPTAKLLKGDFSEVAPAYPSFRLYNPATGDPSGANRSQFPGFALPSGSIDPIARRVRGYSPLPHTTADLNSNQLADDYSINRVVKVDRDNYDT